MGTYKLLTLFMVNASSMRFISKANRYFTELIRVIVHESRIKTKLSLNNLLGLFT